MDDWQKDFWEVIETVALGIENFSKKLPKLSKKSMRKLSSIWNSLSNSRGFTPGIRGIF